MGVCASTPKADAEPEAKVSRRKNVPTPAEVADAAVLEARAMCGPHQRGARGEPSRGQGARADGRDKNNRVAGEELAAVVDENPAPAAASFATSTST